MLKINTMKKQIFTLLIMLALVAVTGNVFAQTGSTPVAPYEGATHTYVLGGLTNGDTYVWGISTSANVYTTTTGDYAVTSTPALGNTGTVSGGSATLTVKWNTGAAGDNYWVWIQIIDQAGCPTYRALPVVPVAAPATYTVDFTVTALNDAGDETTTATNITNGTYSVNPTDVCPKFVGEDWISDGGINDATTTDGNTYVYFRVDRNSTPATASGWNITPTTSGASAWEVSTDASSWATMNATQTVTTGNVLYVRATVQNATTSQVVNFDITTTGQDAGGLYTDANTEGVGSNSNSASVTLNPLPEVGTFGGSF